MEFGWRIVVGTLLGILGAAFGSVGGVGGGGIFVPMLILILGFDPKSAVSISKCKHFFSLSAINLFRNAADTANNYVIFCEETTCL